MPGCKRDMTDAQHNCPPTSPIPSCDAGAVPLGTTTGFLSPLPFLRPQTRGEPEHPHFSGHCLANGLLICSIVPCEANSISARDSSLAVDTVMDRTSGCHHWPWRPFGTLGTHAGLCLHTSTAPAGPIHHVAPKDLSLAMKNDRNI